MSWKKLLKYFGIMKKLLKYWWWIFNIWLVLCFFGGDSWGNYGFFDWFDEIDWEIVDIREEVECIDNELSDRVVIEDLDDVVDMVKIEVFEVVVMVFNRF